MVKKKKDLHTNLKLMLMSELVGSFLLIFVIAGPSIFGVFEKETYDNQFSNVMDIIFRTFPMRAVWFATGTWLILMLLNKISCNLNPVVTLFSHTEFNFSKKETSLKLIVQFSGTMLGLLTCLGIFLLCFKEAPFTIGAVQPGLHQSYKSTDEILAFDPFNPFPVDKWWYYSFQVIFEYVTTLTLLIFSYLARNKNWKGSKSLIIWLGLVVAITLGYRTGNTGINPAKTFCTGVVSGIYNLSSNSTPINPGAVKIMPFLMTSEILAAITIMKFSKYNKQKTKIILC